MKESGATFELGITKKSATIATADRQTTVGGCGKEVRSNTAAAAPLNNTGDGGENGFESLDVSDLNNHIVPASQADTFSASSTASDLLF